MFAHPYFYCFLRPWLKFYYQRLSSHSNFLNINDIKRKKILRFRAYKVSEYYNILRPMHRWVWWAKPLYWAKDLKNR